MPDRSTTPGYQAALMELAQALAKQEITLACCNERQCSRCRGWGWYIEHVYAIRTTEHKA